MVTGRERRSPSPPRPSSGVTSSPIAFQWSSRSTRSRSTRPTRSLNRATPSDAMITRTSSASSVKKRMTCSGLPANRSRSTGSCVAIPTGHVFRWQTRIMMQPIAISGAVEAPISSAPSSAAITTSRARAHPAVGLQHDPRAQPVAHERLLRLGQPELPRHARVLERGLR